MADPQNETARVQAENEQLRRHIREMEAELEGRRAQNTELRAIMDGTSIFIGLLDKDGLVLDINQKALAFIGRSMEDVRGVPFWETPWWTHTRQEQERVKQFIERAKQGEYVQQEVTHRGKDGKLIHVDFSLTPVKDSTGSICLLIPEGRDITWRWKTEQSLSIFRKIVAASPDHMAFIDRNGILLAANQTMLAAYGVIAENVLHLPVLALLSQAAPREQLSECLAECDNQGGSCGMWLDLPARGRHFMEVSITPYVQEGKLDGKVYIAHDATERLQLEQTLDQVRDEERRLIGSELHDDLSHDLLGAAIQAKVLSRKLQDERPQEAALATELKNDLNKAIRKTKQLARGFFPINLDKGGLRSVAREIGKHLEGKFGIHCHLDIDPHLETEDMQRATHLYYIIREAAGNAAHHSGASNIWITLRGTGNQVLLSVRDDGHGMASNGQRGAGLGLHIMRYRAALLRGTLDVRSARPTGTEVICRFKTA